MLFFFFCQFSALFWVFRRDLIQSGVVLLFIVTVRKVQTHAARDRNYVAPHFTLLICSLVVYGVLALCLLLPLLLLHNRNGVVPWLYWRNFNTRQCRKRAVPDYSQFLVGWSVGFSHNSVAGTLRRAIKKINPKFCTPFLIFCLHLHGSSSFFVCIA